MRDLKLADNRLERIPVLRPVDRLMIGSDDLNPPFEQRLCQIHRRLSTQRCDHAYRMLQFDNIHDILYGQRFKIQLIRSGIVCRDRLRIIIDHDRFIAKLMNRLHRMDRGIIEFHSLPDPDRSGAEHYDLLFIGNHRFILFLIGRVEIRHIAFKFAGTGIDHLIDREDFKLPPVLPDLFLCDL